MATVTEGSVDRPPAPSSTLRPVASTRIALQMAVGLAAAFTVGFLVFSDRWAWVVLSAFIVASGNRGRGDVAYKSILRVGGAAVGTVIALGASLQSGGRDAQTVALILAAVFFGIWLRPLGYAWWALFVTIALSLLQGYDGVGATVILWPRLEEIVIGAAIGVAAAWFVLPVRSILVLRRRIADALATLQAAVDPEAAEPSAAPFVAEVARVQQVLPAFRARRLLTGRFSSIEPADWGDALAACTDPAVALIGAGETTGSVRRAVGRARRAVREPVGLHSALEQLRAELESAAAGSR